MSRNRLNTRWARTKIRQKYQVPLRFKLRLEVSESSVITNFTMGPYPWVGHSRNWTHNTINPKHVSYPYTKWTYKMEKRLLIKGFTYDRKIACDPLSCTDTAAYNQILNARVRLHTGTNLVLVFTLKMLVFISLHSAITSVHFHRRSAVIVILYAWVIEHIGHFRLKC